MGCAVNGPGEAGVTGAGDKVLIVRRGQIVRTIELADADRAFAEELDRL